MYCGYCGTENADSSNYCKSCGKPLVAPSISVEQTPPFNPVPNNESADVGEFSTNADGGETSINEIPFASISDLPNNSEKPFFSEESFSREVFNNSVTTIDNDNQPAEAEIDIPEQDAAIQNVRLADLCPTFAKDLPEWDLVPPSTLVVRK